MITKNTNGAGANNKVLVIFSMPPIDDCDCLYLVGKFSGEWNESVYRMQRADDGTWSLALELECDYNYQYRYRTNQGIWYSEVASHECARGSVKDDSNGN
jgi:hypothetical protein